MFNHNPPPPPSEEMPPPKAAPAEPVQSSILPNISVPPAPVAPASPQTALAAAVPSAPVAASAAKAKVAILLPLSGSNAALGQAMLNAAQMAVFDMSGGNFELMPRDTDGSEASGVAAAQDAISSGAQLVIGPLFGTQVPGVRSVVEPAGISMLTLSTDTSLSAPGVFVMGFAPSAQVERVVNFAISKGLKRFAAVAPDSPYGSLVTQAFRQSVTRDRGTIVDLETYNPEQHNSLAAVAALSSYRDQVDALFLPEGGEEIATIAAQLAGAGFDAHRVRLIGTGLWDEPGLGQRIAFLDGGWYAAPDPAARHSFVSAYAHAYGQEPPRVATLAYDATAMAAVLARRGEHFDRVALTNPNGFAGVDGIFRLTDNGLVERGLAVDEVASGGDRVVSPAPMTFVGNGR
jgi:ABC-type branched-subunit amino acid transport system substrate-binding protein